MLEEEERTVKERQTQAWEWLHERDCRFRGGLYMSSHRLVEGLARDSQAFIPGTLRFTTFRSSPDNYDCGAVT